MSAKEMRALETEQLVTVAQRARSPEVAVAQHLVSENRPALRRLEPDSREPLAAWRSDPLERAFSAPARPPSAALRG